MINVKVNLDEVLSLLVILNIQDETLQEGRSNPITQLSLFYSTQLLCALLYQ